MMALIQVWVFAGRVPWKGDEVGDKGSMEDGRRQHFKWVPFVPIRVGKEEGETTTGARERGTLELKLSPMRSKIRNTRLK